jgi:hypothetical protein
MRSIQAGVDTAGNVLVNHWFKKLRGRISTTRQLLVIAVQDLVLVQIVQVLFRELTDGGARGSARPTSRSAARHAAQGTRNERTLATPGSQ